MPEPVIESPLITAKQARERMPCNFTDQFDEQFKWISDQIQQFAWNNCDGIEIYFFSLKEENTKNNNFSKYIECPDSMKVIDEDGEETLFLKRLLVVFNELGYKVHASKNCIYIKW